ncbi:MAG: radical SAM protein [Nitrospirae bacterium RBG_16_43_11]|nr:MAG: radical SAM protein [Nitrospirae bacterium RBG_16_43_11]
MEASVIVTYRCDARCHMCNTWKYPTALREEIRPDVLNKLPRLAFCNVTGGEPFLREDIEEIVSVIRKRAGRIVISTNGFSTDRILSVAKQFPDIGFRISIEGLPAANDELRGIKDGFDHGLRSLLELQRMGIKDIGFGITVSDRNARDMMELYQLAKSMNLEFATAAVHNSYYFHKYDNEIKGKETAIACFEELIRELLKSGKVKDWFRAYFNYGLINYIRGGKRLLPCEAGTENFFVDPWGEIMPCNGLDKSIWMESMGNLNDNSFEDIWNGEMAKIIRDKVRTCPKNCWMIGTASPVMKKYISKPVGWIIKRKLFGIHG